MGMRDTKILRGVPLVPITRLSLPMYLATKLREGGNNPLLIHAENGRKLSYEEVLGQSARLAEALKLRGLVPGDVIAVCSENSLEFFLPVMASFFMGTACSPLSYNYTPRELQHSLSLTTPRAVFFSASTQDAVMEALNELKARPLLVRLPDEDGEDEGGEGFETLGKLLSSVPYPMNYTPYKPADPSECVGLIMCSSGTTGLPKGVQLSHTNILAGLANPKHPQYEINHSSNVFPGHLPMFHVFGLMCILGAIVRDFCVIVMPFFSPDTFLKIIEDYKVSSIPLVPPLMQLLAHSELVNQYDVSTLKHLSCGAAPLSRELQNAVTDRLKLPDIRQGYGLTECTLAALMVPNGKNKPGTSGMVVPGMECKVVDEKGTLLGPNQPGEMCFRGVLVMKGYANNPKATAETIDSEGWLHTGDIAYYDKDGCFFVVDRLKELIKYKGFQVPPAELEAILQTHPGVEDAAVIGVPDAKAGELPLAFVVRKDEALTEKQVQDFVAKHVSPQKRLRGGVRFVTSIPKNPAGKILRRELRELIKSKL